MKRALGLRPEMSWSFYLLDFVFRRIFRQNARTCWAVHHTATIHHPQGLTKGVGTFPGDSPGVYINANNGVHIGDYTNLGPQVGIISSNHNFIDNDTIVKAEPIRIGRFCWLGMSAKVLPGVVLGDFTIVGAGTVVTKSFPGGYCIIAGNPARVIRELSKAECDEQARIRDAAQSAQP